MCIIETISFNVVSFLKNYLLHMPPETGTCFHNKCVWYFSHSLIDILLVACSGTVHLAKFKGLRSRLEGGPKLIPKN